MYIINGGVQCKFKRLASFNAWQTVDKFATAYILGVGSYPCNTKMTDISQIITATDHRPFELPIGKWKYYQEWNNALFLHWTIPLEVLQSCVPQKLKLDNFNGDFYVSLVAFTMQKIRPKNLPAIKYISDFHEINLRTYICNDGKRGVYFLNIEAGKMLSAFIAKSLSGLPYEKANINRTKNKYRSTNNNKCYHLDTEFEIGQDLSDKTDLDKWLTERYCLYFDKDNEIFRYDIHHKEWRIKTVNISRLNLSYKIGGLNLSDRKPNLTHYSDGVKVIAWRRQRLTTMFSN
jgi:uncharacterized protein YqjF (DUF2071 family)